MTAFFLCGREIEWPEKIEVFCKEHYDATQTTSKNVTSFEKIPRDQDRERRYRERRIDIF